MAWATWFVDHLVEQKNIIEVDGKTAWGKQRDGQQHARMLCAPTWGRVGGEKIGWCIYKIETRRAPLIINGAGTQDACGPVGA